MVSEMAGLHRAIVRATEPPKAATWTIATLSPGVEWAIIRGAWVFDRKLDAERLRRGLQLVLGSYPQLAGRMARGMRVRLNNAGVPFGVASRADLSIRDFAENPGLAYRHCDRIRPALMQLGLEPVLKVRVTHLADGTLVTVACSHAICDGRTFYTFVRNWSWACMGRPFPAPVADPSLMPAMAKGSKREVEQRALDAGWFKPSLRTMLRTLLLMLSGRLKESRKVAYFSPDALRRLHRRAAAQTSSRGIRIFEALQAHLARMCARLVGLADETQCSQVAILDARRHVPSLPPDYAGDAAFAVFSPTFPAGASLGEIAECLHEANDPILCVPSTRLVEEEIPLVRALVHHRVFVSPMDFAAMNAARPRLTFVNNLFVLPIWDVDFGEEGNPVFPTFAIPQEVPPPVLIWPAPPDQGGVEIYFAGLFARALRRLPEDDPWWRELRQLEETANASGS